MKRILFLLFTFYALPFTHLYADTIRGGDGKELKGIVVEDYKDRVVLSTADGEKTIMKSDIGELSFDAEEDNLIKLAEQLKDRKDYGRAYDCYAKALKLNPESKAAKDGIVFLQGYLFRKEQVEKEEDVRRQEAIENYGAAITAEESAEEKAKADADNLKKTIGIKLRMEEELPVVESVLAKTPASDAGIKKGDRLVAVWNRLTGYLSLDRVTAMLLDKPSLELKITIERKVDVKLGRFNSLDANLSMQFDGLTVETVKEGGAASLSGIKALDLITAIDGKSARYMPLKTAVEAIKHSKTGYAELTIRREALIWRRD